jgi:hypothetical protein
MQEKSLTRRIADEPKSVSAGAMLARHDLIFSQNLAVFETLKSLVGTWVGTTESGRLLRVCYSLHAKTSVLMESWTLSETVDALTLYHMDHEILMATHYCPLCNQPRLDLVVSEDNSMIAFEFSSATNLQGETDAHQHEFQLRLIDSNTFWRSETYLKDNIATSDAVTYRRAES